MPARSIMILTRFGSHSIACEGDRFLYLQNKMINEARVSWIRHGALKSAIDAAQKQNANAKRWGCLSKTPGPMGASIPAAIMIVRIKKIHD